MDKELTKQERDIINRDKIIRNNFEFFEYIVSELDCLVKKIQEYLE